MSPAARAAAVLFDMDGVLVDSEPLWTVAEEELARSLGTVWRPDIKAAVVGNRLDVSVPLMLALLGAPAGRGEVEQARAFLLDRMCRLFSERLPLCAGADALVADLHSRKVPLALVSSSYRVLVDAGLSVLGAARFATSVAGDEVDQAKPHPEPYLTAARALGVDPTRCVVVEDTATGVASAEAAGCVCVAVLGVVPVLPTATRPVVESLRDIDPDWLLSLPAGSAVVDRPW